MVCKVADLITVIPEAGGMAPRCRDYLCQENRGADIIIRTELYDPQKCPASAGPEDLAYMESGRQFCAKLLEYDGFYLHASAVELDGKAYLFSAHSGTGKSTHSRLWQSLFGERAQVFNDDKPALRRLDGVWYAYGTPWCGKDGINQNKKVPVAGICFLKQANENRIRRLGNQEVLSRILSKTIYRFDNPRKLDLLLSHLSKLLMEIPCFELENRPELEAARLSYETMRRVAEEMGL